MKNSGPHWPRLLKAAGKVPHVKTDFNKWVKTHTGCTAKRRAATDAEKAAHKETRKGTCYFIDVTLTRSAQVELLGTGTGTGSKRPVSAGSKK